VLALTAVPLSPAPYRVQHWTENEARETDPGICDPPVPASVGRLEHPLVLDAPVQGVGDPEEAEQAQETPHNDGL
jgi:hypothetical protein